MPTLAREGKFYVREADMPRYRVLPIGGVKGPLLQASIPQREGKQARRAERTVLQGDMDVQETHTLSAQIYVLRDTSVPRELE